MPTLYNISPKFYFILCAFKNLTQTKILPFSHFIDHLLLEWNLRIFIFESNILSSTKIFELLFLFFLSLEILFRREMYKIGRNRKNNQ